MSPYRHTDIMPTAEIISDKVARDTALLLHRRRQLDEAEADAKALDAALKLVTKHVIGKDRITQARHKWISHVVTENGPSAPSWATHRPGDECPLCGPLAAHRARKP